MGFLQHSISRFAGTRRRIPQGAQGARAYAIGDIHGRADLLDDLLARIEADMAAAPLERMFLIFLGDLIDRGPASRAVVERLRLYRNASLRIVFLMGNHEEVLLRILDGEGELLEPWLRLGGSECAQSYGIDPVALRRSSEAAAVTLLRANIPGEHVQFLRQFADTFRFGDYLFVHAGIRPGLPLEYQRPRDLRWIREPFLGDEADHGFVVVHGHTVVESVEERRNRIAIDTGAVHSGVLTAVVIEGVQRRYIATA